MEPRFPRYLDLDERVNSFRIGLWPHTSPRIEDMANSGFFYTRQDDNATCFHCGGVLGRWDPGDDPSKDHATYFPWCQFLREIKGSQYVGNQSKRSWEIAKQIASQLRDNASQRSQTQALTSDEKR